MEAPGQLPGSGTSPALREFILELSGHSLNGGPWLVTRKMNKSRTRGLNLRLRAILRENGGAWLVSKYLTFDQIMHPRVKAPCHLPGHHYKS